MKNIAHPKLQQTPSSMKTRILHIDASYMLKDKLLERYQLPKLTQKKQKIIIEQFQVKRLNQ